MSGVNDLTWRFHRARAAAAPGGTIQPPPPTTGPLRWVRAASNWINAPGNGSYVRAYPCADAAGNDPDTTVALKVALPRAPGTDPNVVADQVIGCLIAADGVLVAATGYLDDAIGTIRLWAIDTGDPPAGWTECIPGGTYGHGPPRVEHLNGRFPVGRDTADEDLDTVDKTGGAAEHCHTLLKDNATDTCSYVQIDEGQWQSHFIGIVAAGHLPPFCVVRFIERVDNSLPA